MRDIVKTLTIIVSEQARTDIAYNIDMASKTDIKGGSIYNILVKKMLDNVPSEVEETWNSIKASSSTSISPVGFTS